MSTPFQHFSMTIFLFIFTYNNYYTNLSFSGKIDITLTHPIKIEKIQLVENAALP